MCLNLPGPNAFPIFRPAESEQQRQNHIKKLLPKSIKFALSNYHPLTISSLLPLSIQDLDLGWSSLGTVSLPSSMLLLSSLFPHLDLHTSSLLNETKQVTDFKLLLVAV